MALATIEKVLFLKSVQLFDQIPAEQLVKVAQIAEEVVFEAGEAFIKQGEPGDCLYIVVEGAAVISLNGGGVVGQIGAKQVIGEMAILSGEPRNATCTAKDPLLALKIGRRDFWILLEERVEIAMGVIKTLVHNLNQANQKLQGYTSERLLEQ
jgi:CRP-like cAMP-binding protein